MIWDVVLLAKQETYKLNRIVSCGSCLARGSLDSAHWVLGIVVSGKSIATMFSRSSGRWIFCAFSLQFVYRGWPMRILVEKNPRKPTERWQVMVVGVFGDQTPQNVYSVRWSNSRESANKGATSSAARTSPLLEDNANPHGGGIWEDLPLTHPRVQSALAASSEIIPSPDMETGLVTQSLPCRKETGMDVWVEAVALERTVLHCIPQTY